MGRRSDARQRSRLQERRRGVPPKAMSREKQCSSNGHACLRGRVNHVLVCINSGFMQMHDDRGESSLSCRTASLDETASPLFERTRSSTKIRKNEGKRRSPWEERLSTPLEKGSFNAEQR